MKTKEDYETLVNELTKRFNEQKEKLEEKYQNKMNELSLKEKELNQRENEIESREEQCNRKSLELENQVNSGVTEAQSELLEQYSLKYENEFKSFQNQIKETQTQLDSKMKEYVAKEADLKSFETELNEREERIILKEKEALEGFVSKKNEESVNYAKKISEMVDSFKDQMDAMLDATNMKNKELSDNFIKYLNDKTEESEKAHIQYLSTYADKLQHVKEEVENQKKNEITKMNQEIENQRKNNEALLESELNARRNSVKIREEEVTEREKKCTENEARITAAENAFNAEKTRIEGIDAQANEKQERLNQHEIELQEREFRLDEIIELRSKELAEQRITDLNAEVEYYKNQALSQMSAKDVLDRIEQIQAEWGEDPQILIARMKENEERYNHAVEELNKRPANVVEEYKKLQERCKNIELRETEASEKDDKIKHLESENAKLRAIVTELDTKDTIIQKQDEEIERLKGVFKKKENEEERIAKINTPVNEFNFETTGGWDRMSKDTVLKGLGNDVKLGNNDGECDEHKWLKNIEASCKSYDISFNPRILKAFHTALKTSELSPLTVLSGVSGTGKSELPRLYANFGGLPFKSIAVQPNWDSKESMLGYFNSIDNVFEATDVLKLLAQADGKKSGSSSLNDFMSLILLDEMNLSNVELYFAEFLSKLETRRGCKPGKEPYIGVKIGSGYDDYRLTLGRNVLWTGTMNQDETTKTLSDKVLDRGIVINFPSPNELRSRKNVSIPLPENREFLTKDIWNSWIRREIQFEKDEIKTYKEITQNINKSLNLTGRALGHRVWQSIEYYMANYPDVILAQKNNDKHALKRAMNIAFEDQLVQKIMPKLRGLEINNDAQATAIQSIRTEIETAGKTLDDELNMNKILKDYDNAKECNYGSFMWCTSDYLNEDNKDNPSDAQD